MRVVVVVHGGRRHVRQKERPGTVRTTFHSTIIHRLVIALSNGDIIDAHWCENAYLGPSETLGKTSSTSSSPMCFSFHNAYKGRDSSSTVQFLTAKWPLRLNKLGLSIGGESPRMLCHSGLTGRCHRSWRRARFLSRSRLPR